MTANWLVLFPDVFLVLVLGAVGGFLNAVLTGGEQYRVPIPRLHDRHIEFRGCGPIIIGMGAAVAAWLGVLHEVNIYSMALGCLLASVGGANYLTSRADVRELKSAVTQSAIATSALADVADAVDLDREDEGERDQDDE